MQCTFSPSLPYTNTNLSFRGKAKEASLNAEKLGASGNKKRLLHGAKCPVDGHLHAEALYFTFPSQSTFLQILTVLEPLAQLSLNPESNVSFYCGLDYYSHKIILLHIFFLLFIPYKHPQPSDLTPLFSFSFSHLDSNCLLYTSPSPRD